LINCVHYAEVERHLLKLGFEHLGEAGGQHVFQHPDRPGGRPALCSIHVPNPQGEVTELSVDESFHAAEIDVPSWTVTWCD
jgi:predicted RNA binding protein YcfA (HicA-like mRNA interferase family)